jgi:hypothetical protein
MEQKERYSVQELYDNLEISMLELSRRSHINPGTLLRIKKGQPARRPTINKLLRAFSEIYAIRLSVHNVSGIHLEGEILQPEGTEKAEKALVLPEGRQEKVITEQAEKRPYTRKQKNIELPDGCILASKFAEGHGVARPTFIDHMTKGLGPGLVGMSTDTIPQRDQVAYSERPKPGRPHEKEKYLTSNQQHEAFKFWQRHHISFAECHDIGCRCHTIKNGEE